MDVKPLMYLFVLIAWSLMAMFCLSVQRSEKYTDKVKEEYKSYFLVSVILQTLSLLFLLDSF